MGEELLQKFGLRLARLLNPQLPLQTVQAAIIQVINEARAAGSIPTAVPRERLHDAGHMGALAGRKLELVFVHDCRNHGCKAPQCILCKHNPNKRCSGNFATKYWVGDRLLAKCEAEIQVELLDLETQERVTDVDMSGYRLEACILEGQKYNQRCREAGEQRLEILDECEVLLNQKREPLLVSASANNTAEDPHVILKFPPGNDSVPIREMKVTESSESVLAGTKRPPFRLVFRLVREEGMRMDVRPAVSEEFVVVTKRTKNLKKQEIPSLDDPIAKLNHVGKETVKKLNELKASADEMQIDLGLPMDLARITKVKDFLRLAKLSEADGHLQQKLKQLLKLSKEKWDMACEHAKTAVQVDNRMRAWYMQNMSLGLLYTCNLGDVRPDCPVALIQNRHQNGNELMEVIPMEQQVPTQREQVHGTCVQAIQCWWADSHPGWMIFTLGNRHFETLEQIIQFSKSGQQIEPVVNEPDDDAEFQLRRSFPAPDQMAADSASSGPADQHSKDRIGRQPGSNHSGVTTVPAARASERSQVGSPQHSSAERAHGLPPLPEQVLPARKSMAGMHDFSTSSALPLGGNGGGGGGHNPSPNPNPFEHMIGMPYHPPSSGLASEDLKIPRSAQAATNAAAAIAAAWPQFESLGATGSIPLFSLNTLHKLGSVPSLGGMTDCGLALNSLQFPELDMNGHLVSLPQVGGMPMSSAGLLRASTMLEAHNGKRGAAELEGDEKEAATEAREPSPPAKRAALEAAAADG